MSKITTLKHLLSAACLFVGMTAQAQDNFYHFSEVDKNVKSTSMSPNGKYVVGIDYRSVVYGNTFSTGYSSFLWNVENNTKEWMTVASDALSDNTGYFRDVNDSGTIVGSRHDEQNQITLTLDGITATRPVSTAAVWQNGKVQSLDMGPDFKFENCKHFTDGTVAVAISNNGTTIAGNYVENDNAYPCVWRLSDKGNWEYQSLSLSEKNGLQASMGTVRDISADGSVIVGDVFDKETSSYFPAYWKNNELHVIFPKPADKDLSGRHVVSSALAVSPDGEYLSLKFKKKNLAVYSVSKRSYVRVEQVFGSNNLDYAPVSNNGNVMPTFSCGRLMDGGVYYRPMYYNYENNSLVDFSYFLKVYVSDVDFPYNVELEDKPTVYISSVSTDGITVMGNNEAQDPNNSINKLCETWVLRASLDNAKLPSVPQSVSAKLTGMSEVTMTWPAVHDDNYKLKAYRIYQNGKVAADINFDAAVENYKYVISKSLRGYVDCTVSAIYEQENGKTLESPKSTPALVAVPYSDANSLFEDFEKDKWKKNLWTFSKEVENDQIADSWGCLEYHGIDGSSAGLTVAHRTNKPYSLSAISRPVNATLVEGNMQFAMAVRKIVHKSPNTDLSKDSLSLDVSTDWGNTWDEVAVWTGERFNEEFVFESVDITKQTRGKIFQIRLRSHGQAVVPVEFIIDLLSVQEESAYVPSGLMAIDMDDNSRMLRWKNNYGAYELNYMCSPFTSKGGKTIGNNGKEIIGANLYDAKTLAPFDGKYLTTVTTALNWYEGDKHQVDAAVVVWEDDVLVREQSFPVKTFNQNVVVKLDEPLQINAAKSIKVGIKVNNYPVNQLPLLYYSTDKYINGQSNLYTEDGGKTWSTLKEAFAMTENPEDGYGVWRISAGITDESTVEINSKDRNPLFAYNLYRDGKKVNDELIYVLEGRMVEKNVPAGSSYEVRGYYEKGGVSQLSEVLSTVPSGIQNQMTDETVVYDPAQKVVSFGKNFKQAALYTTAGKKVAETTQSQMEVSNLPGGIYILHLEAAGASKSYKLLVE